MTTAAPRIFAAEAMRQVEGATILSAFPSAVLRHRDPFVLLHEFFIESSGGFGDHPHRGFEIITYMLDGAMRHRDNLGNDRVISSGGVQRITAGRGIVHAEMPATDALNHGLQLWIALPSRAKQIDPSYQEVLAHEIPEQSGAGWRARTIVGDGSPVRLATPARLTDISLDAHARLDVDVPDGWRGFVYVMGGALVEPGDVGKGALGLIDGPVTLRAESAARCAVIIGKPWGEPIRLRGPYVD